MKSTKDKIKNKLIDELNRPVTKKISLFNIFPKLKNDEYQVTDIEGLQCDYQVFFYKYFFKYSGNRELIAQYISNIKCHYSEIVPDTALIKMVFDTKNNIIYHMIENFRE